MVALGALNYLITFTCLIGLGLSIYAYIVELQAASDPKYKAMCDINEHMSCTRVFTSQYARGFGLLGKFLGKDSIFNQPNSIAGILVYSLLATLGMCSSKLITRVSQIIIIGSVLSSFYFAYILFVVLKDICVVCIATYFVNFANLFLVGRKIKKIKELEKGKSKVKKN